MRAPTYACVGAPNRVSDKNPDKFSDQGTQPIGRLLWIRYPQR